MKKSRSLLVDTNRSALPIYQELCRRGHEVWVVGGNQCDFLARVAPNHILLDYSDAGKLRSLVEEKAFDYLIPGCNDLSYKVCAQINDGRFPGLDSPVAVDSIHNKAMFRQVATGLGLPVPRILDSSAIDTDQPVIIKPVDSFSGRGISVLKRPNAIQLEQSVSFARAASKTGAAIVEEYVVGQLYSHSAFIRGRSVIMDFIVQEDCTANAFTVDTSRVLLSFSQKILDCLRADITRLAEALDLADGLVHTQFIVREDSYWVIEVTRRCPGDLYSQLIEFSTCYGYAASYVAPFMGEPPFSKECGKTHNWILRHTISRSDAGTLAGFEIPISAEIRMFVPLATSGDVIEASPFGRVGILFLRADSADQLEMLYDLALRRSLCMLH